MARKLALFAVIVASGCSPASAPSAASPSGDSGSGSGSAEETCIASANGKHPRRANEPDAVTVRHILVKHVGSKNYTQGLKRTRGEACLRAAEALGKLKAGEDFTKLVAEYSDSRGPSNDGALGSVQRAGLDPAFADAAFELDAGQMSNVVETAFGFHVIVRTE